ncbi:MAG: hypothetical protein ACRDQW_05580 [Haloechinothrix sp.]
MAPTGGGHFVGSSGFFARINLPYAGSLSGLLPVSDVDTEVIVRHR